MLTCFENVLSSIKVTYKTKKAFNEQYTILKFVLWFI